MFYDSGLLATIPVPFYMALVFPTDFFNRFPDNRDEDFPTTTCYLYRDQVIIDSTECSVTIFPAVNVMYLKITATQLEAQKLYTFTINNV